MDIKALEGLIRELKATISTYTDWYNRRLRLNRFSAAEHIAGLICHAGFRLLAIRELLECTAKYYHAETETVTEINRLIGMIEGGGK